MFEEDYEDRIYNLIISNGFDRENEYGQFTERIFSKPEFLWKESISGSYATASPSFYENVDAIIILAGLYKDNRDTIDELVDVSEKYDIPIVLVRPYGVEEVPENLEEKAKTIVGWNGNCIIDAIKNAVNLEDDMSCEL